MNRTLIRGILAGSVGAAAIALAVVVGPAIASGAEGVPASAGQAEAWPMPTVKEMRHLPVHAAVQHRHRVRHHHASASRASHRAALSPQEVARAMLLRQGGSEAQWSCLDTLWTRESNWEVSATNAGSGAYGIPQALPSYKMASAGSDWRTNAVTQIRWGLTYIAEKYGSPCVALSHSDSYGYY